MERVLNVYCTTGEHMVLISLLRERARQEQLKLSGKFKFSCADDGMNEFERLSVLAEEFGEVAHEVNETVGGNRPLDVAKLRAELIQLAAVAVAWVENIDQRT